VKRAFILLRDAPGYPREAVAWGAASLGYTPQFGGVDRTFNVEDLLITWTPWRGSLSHRLGEQHRRDGGKWIVMENGYIDGTKVKQYAVGLNGFNGSGDHRNVGSDCDRWMALCLEGLDLKPWRETGEHIVVFGQMGVHDHRFSMPPNWPDEILDRLLLLTPRKVLYRPKPSRPRLLNRPHPNAMGLVPEWKDIPLERLLQNAWATVVYNSKCAVESIRRGIPALYDGTQSIISSLVERGINCIETPPQPAREQFFYDLAYAQWSADEVATGYPFERLLS